MLIFEDALKKIIEDTVVFTLQKIGVTDINRNDMPEIMTVKQLSEYLKVSASFIYQNKDIPCQRIGKKLTFNKNEIDAWLSAKTNEKKPINKTAIKSNNNKIYKIS